MSDRLKIRLALDQNFPVLVLRAEEFLPEVEIAPVHRVRRLVPGKGQVFRVNPRSPQPEVPWDYFKAAALRRRSDPEMLYGEEMRALDALDDEFARMAAALLALLDSHEPDPSGRCPKCRAATCEVLPQAP